MLLSHDTMIGTVTLAATTTGLAICSFDDVASIARRHPAVQAGSGSPHLDLARRELDEYFPGRLREFTVPVDLRFAPPFDRTALDGVRAVRYGSTTGPTEIRSKRLMIGVEQRLVRAADVVGLW